LHLLGHAWIDRVDQATRRSAVKVVQLKEAGGRRRLVLPVRNTYRPECTTYSGQKQYNYDWAGWELVLDPARLRSGGQWREGTWHLGLALASSGLLRKRSLQAGGPKRANHPPYQWLDDRFRLLPTIEKGALKLRVERVRALITGYRADGEHVAIEGELRESVTPGETLKLRVTNRKSGEQHEYVATGLQPAGENLLFELRVPLRDVALMPHHQEYYEKTDTGTGSAERARAARRTWSTELVSVTALGAERRFSTVVADGLSDAQIRLPSSFGERAARNEVAVVSGWNGYLKLCGRPIQAVLTDVSWSDGRFALAGVTQERLDEPVLVVTARDRFDEKTVPVRLGRNGSFEASFSPATMSGASGTLPLKCGRWNFFLRSPELVNDVPFVIDRQAVSRFPVEGEHRGRRYAFEARWHDFPQLNCLSDLSVMEHGAYRQNRLLEDVYRAGRRNPLRDAVLYISYNGKQYSDSPRAVHEEMLRRGVEIEHLWLVRDSQVELPPTVTGVRMWGTEWYEALARCRYIVTNAHLPHWLERREGQVIVQTWHGTMLKKIGLDIEAPVFDSDYHERLRAEAGQWSLLVSANRFSTPILERAMAYDGPILEAGYPRNDYLYAADQEVRTKDTRKRLGLPEGRKVVLYAPTWRDHLSHRRGHFRFDLRLDIEAARRYLGDDHVLLIRRHSNVVDSVPGSGDGFVRDVSEYPDIADLYLVADILITDYSSVMFDYAHLKRPMLFFTYDLEHYRDTLRGFYFDFEEDAPGPLIRTSEELVDAIRDIDRVSAAYEERYRRFHRLFCDLDDGHASERVVDRMLEPAGAASPGQGTRNSAGTVKGTSHEENSAPLVEEPA
ncbi:MAG: CDP-glycerol glycerophosphotransferase family protein, partial [Streptomyces sp.]